MTRTIFGLVVKEGLYLSLVMTVVITATFLWNPYLWLGDYPPDIQAVVGEVEIPDVQITISGLVFITAGVVMLIRSYKRLAREYRGELGFVKAFTLLFMIGLVFSLFDLVVLDWLVFCTIQPDFIILPGTGGMAGYHDYTFHAREAFLSITPYMGNALLALISTVIGRRV